MTGVADDEILEGEVLEDDPQQWPLYDAALDYLAHGWTPTPLRAKRPTQKRWVGLKPSGADCWAWWVEDNHDGVGIVCGVISRHLVVVDLESELVADQEAMTRVMLAAAALGAADLVTRALTGSSATTPSHGLHLYFEVTDTETVPGNEKLAFRGIGDKAVLLAETRGEGGQVAAPPGAGRQWRGDSGPGVTTKVTYAQLQAVLGAFRTLDESGIKREAPKPRRAWTPDSHRDPTVADAWVAPLMDRRITWADILDEGWTPNGYDDEGRSLWVRPDYGDKTRAPYSAKGFEGWLEGPIPVLVNHSSSVVHLPAGAGHRLTPARAWACCFFNGDEASANAALEALASGGDIDPRIERPVPTCVLDEARRIVTERAEKKRAAEDWVNNLPGGQTPVVEVSVEDSVFMASPSLEHIRTAARARMVSPWALLGAVLARCVAEVGPRVALPAIIGSRASLNAFYAIVGPSGAAKTAAANVADDLLDIVFPIAKVQGTGTGEGLVASFLERDPEASTKGNTVLVLKDKPNVMMVIDEIGQIAAIQSRQGASLAPILRSAWSGSALDNVNADLTRRRFVPKMSYRLTVVAGVQPLAAGVLFDDADTGTPQRWVWLPALDPHMPDEAPDWPGALEWKMPVPVWDHHGNHTISVPDHVREAVRAAHRARNRGQSHDMLDGHLTLTRLKLAAALSILHGYYDIDDATWELAGLVADVSVTVRDQCRAAIHDEAERAMRSRGRIDQARESGRREAVAEAIQKDAARVWRSVDIGSGGGHDHAGDAGCTRRCITQRLPRRTPDQRDAAIAYAIDMDWIAEKNEDGGRVRYVKTGTSQPGEQL